jgi:hypothetical protein
MALRATLRHENHGPSALSFNGAGGFRGCGKTLFRKRFVSGHDFSRVANAAKRMWALAPEGMTAWQPNLRRGLEEPFQNLSQ